MVHMCYDRVYLDAGLKAWDHDYWFWFGDLNYRIDDGTGTAGGMGCRHVGEGHRWCRRYDISVWSDKWTETARV